MQVIVHHQIADLYNTLGMKAEGDIEFTILSIPNIHPSIPFKSPMLRADYFSFIFTKEGSGVYYLDDNRYPFGSGSFYFTNPGHLKYYELHESKDASIIVLSESFLREHVHPEIYSEFPFLLAEIVPPKNLSPAEVAEFETLYGQIEVAFQRPSAYKNRILGNLFSVLLLKIKEDFWLDYDPIDDGNRNSQIVRAFRQLLEKQFGSMHDSPHGENRLLASQFAKQLNIHPNYLNAVIKSKTGRTVSDWIAKRTLSLAKNLLTTTSLSSKEIAYRLGFSEPTHFNRFFKNQTNITPATFRKLKTPSGNL